MSSKYQCSKCVMKGVRMSGECIKEVFDFSECANELKGCIKEVLKECVVPSKLQQSAKKVSGKCRGSLEEV